MTNSELERKQKQAEKVCDEWQRKAGDLQTTLDRIQNDAQSTAQDLIHARSQLEETRDQLNAVKRENKTMSGRPLCHIVTDRVSREGEAIGSVRLSVRLFPLYLLNRLTF